MKNLKKLSALLVLIVAAGTVLGEGAKDPSSSDQVVKIAATAEKPDAAGLQKVTITISTDAPYHVYANPSSNESCTATVVSVASGTKPEQVKVEYPEGKLVKDSVGGDYRMYEGTVTITALVKRAAGDTSPLEVNARLQACTEKVCLKAAILKTTAP